MAFFGLNFKCVHQGIISDIDVICNERALVIERFIFGSTHDLSNLNLF